MRFFRLMLHALSAVAASLLTVMVQAVAILLLAPGEYGAFAVMYIGLGLGSAAVYSLVSEAWSRAATSGADWDAYSGTLIGVCGAFLVLAFAIGCALGLPLVGLILGVAVALTLYRSGARYFVLTLDPTARVSPADLLSCLCFALTIAPGLLFPDRLLTIVLCWAVAALVAAGLSKSPSWGSTLASFAWVRTRWAHVRILVVDSALLELGSSGVPLLLTPVMGLAQFGTFRSVTSAAVPVRLLVNPLRPLIAGASLPRLVQTRTMLAIMSCGVLLGAIVSAALYFVELFKIAPESTLSALAHFFVPVGIFVAANLSSTVYYIALRTKVGAGMLIGYRVVQLVATVVGCIGGFLALGLTGAVWGYCTVSACMLFVSIVMLTNRARRDRDFKNRFGDDDGCS